MKRLQLRVRLLNGTDGLRAACRYLFAASTICGMAANHDARMVCDKKRGHSGVHADRLWIGTGKHRRLA